jgi:uncharacterized membrane protein YkvA (DUF1232 family)
MPPRTIHGALLHDVQEQLAQTASSNDHLMLTRWHVLTICQYLLGGGKPDVETECVAALNIFAANGPGQISDAALKRATSFIGKAGPGQESVLPSISDEKRRDVSRHLDAIVKRGRIVVDEAVASLPRIRARVQELRNSIRLPGIGYRVELAAGLLLDSTRPSEERIRAAAALLYVAEEQDVIPDSLGALGMLDDDYALRLILSESDIFTDVRESLHWSEIISVLWDDLPFLQGVNLYRSESPITVSWLDRVNSYVAYTHVLERKVEPLLLLQPSVSCSPLHPIVSLIGLSILDALTSSESRIRTLRAGSVYEMEDCFVRFEGVGGSREPGWIRLALRDCFVYQPPGIADRMVFVGPHRLSSLKEFTSRPASAGADAIQRFFQWETAITPQAISNKLVLVASHRRALDILDGVESNGIRLLDHGLVRFIGPMADDVDIYGTLLLIVPSLAAVRQLIKKGIGVQAIIIDGYEHLHRGRHDAPFLTKVDHPPAVIVWSSTGYYPINQASALPIARRLEVSSEDLVELLELDETDAAAVNTSLLEAATTSDIRPHITTVPQNERDVLGAIDRFLNQLTSRRDLPDYWLYYLRGGAITLRILIQATPAEWSQIRRFATDWISSVGRLVKSLTPSAQGSLRDLESLQVEILGKIDNVSEDLNAAAVGLTAMIDAYPTEHMVFPCDRSQQLGVVESLAIRLNSQTLNPLRLRDVPVCSRCVAAGWISTSFVRRLLAHTPEAVDALIEPDDLTKWKRASDLSHYPVGQSLLEAVGRPRRLLAPTPTLPMPAVRLEDLRTDVASTFEPQADVSCVFVWLNGEPEAKVLRGESRVIVEEGTTIAERPARSLQPGDRVILGLGSKPWSPAEEFTEVIVSAVKSAQPGMVNTAREWRRALRELQTNNGLSVAQLRSTLSQSRVERESQTLEGWMDLERASPIAPMRFETELPALWSLIQPYANYNLDQIIAACKQLRSLRAEASRELLRVWKGVSANLGGIEHLAAEALVKRIRQEVESYEVEAVTTGIVPRPMIGWWVTDELAGQFEIGSSPQSSNPTDNDLPNEEAST